MYLKSSKTIAVLLAILWLSSCPVWAGCYNDQECCDQKCCKNEFSARHCNSAAVASDKDEHEIYGLDASLPAKTLNIYPPAFTYSSDITSDYYQLIGRKSNPSTGPPSV